MHAPIWGIVFLFLIGSAVVLAVFYVRARRNPAVSEPTCGRCGYIVRGIAALNCPECGSDLREVGIVTPGMRQGQGVAGTIVGWTVIVLIVGMVLSNIVMSLLPRLREQIDTQVFRGTGPGFRTLDVEFRAWQYVSDTSNPSFRPPMREIVLVTSRPGTSAVKMTINVNDLTCSINGQAPVPWGFEAVRQWTIALGMSTSDPQVSAEASELFAEVDRAIKANDPNLSLSFLSSSGAGRSGRSGMVLPWVSEGIAVFWLLIWFAGCVWIYRRHRQRNVSAPG